MTNHYSVLEYIEKVGGKLSKNKESVNYCAEGYERLCSAVVWKAVKDYKRALKILRRKPKDIQANLIVADCESFFLDEMKLYSDLDGKAIMLKVQKIVEEESVCK